MDTAPLKKFAPDARNMLRQQVGAKLDAALADGSAARREARDAVTKIEAEIAISSRDDVVERVAYTWFNRFMALCFMDACGHNTPKVLSPRAGETRPEILSEAVAGVIDPSIEAGHATAVRDLLEGRTTSPDPQAEAFRHLVVASCNAWSASMPFLFEATDDPTELLMPEDLLSPDSVVARLRGVMTPDACKDVEIIGWLYQFYISEKKDQVFAGLKKNVKITAQNIPAATQLFTPHWIVRYLVENSLGRLWLLNKPSSNLAAQMDYYIAPEEPETDFLVVNSPEEIKICDPACGSGHMLTYAFDLLYAIYEEEGYDPASIPALILTHNLYGIEIDGRAGALAAFALTMKAAGRNRRFLRAPVQPNICVMENVAFEAQELADYIGVAGRDLFTAPLRDTLGQFAQAKNFGALITPLLPDVSEARRVLAGKDFTTDLLRRETHLKVLTVLKMVEYLAPRYHVVVANPPYMGGKGMSEKMGGWLKSKYPNSNTDLFSAFMERILKALPNGGFAGMMTPFTWMFLSSFENIRNMMTSDYELASLVRPEYHAFFESAFVPICAFTVFAGAKRDRKGIFVDLQRFYGSALQPVKALEAIRDINCGWRHQASSLDFEKIPGRPIAYWVSDDFRSAFTRFPAVGEIAAPRAGLATGDNTVFQREWSEVALSAVAFNCTSNNESLVRPESWYPCNSGGNFRKWYGNNEVVVFWKNDGYKIRNFRNSAGKLKSRPQNTNYFFKPGVTWTKLSSSTFAARMRDPGFIFDDTGRSAFPDDPADIPLLLGHMCSSAVNLALKILNPSMSVTSGDIGNLPYVATVKASVQQIVLKAINVSKADWDAYETSWDFTTLPLLDPTHRQPTLEATYIRLRAHWQSMTDEMLALEEENNRIFIDAYGLADELTPEVPLNEITLTCNPAYRYGGKKTPDELEAQLQADTIAEFMSYAVGCMFGRYSLDAPGLILANQGDTLADYEAKLVASGLVASGQFPPDEDNVIPILDRDWFSDDITDRFRKFLRVTFGEERFQDNLAFIEAALGKDIRKYFTKDFFPDHVRRYKKRPIYWLFTSPKGTFNALIYMHRYRPDTVGTVLTEYLRPLRDKLEAHKQDLDRTLIDPDATSAQRGKAEKEGAEIVKQIKEIEQWERDVLLPMAQKRIEIDLDDGVKVNYLKFKDALKTIPGLEAKEE